MARRPTDKKTTSSEYWVYPNATKALEVALYYGFTPFDPLSLEKSDLDHAKGLFSSDIHDHEPHINPTEEIALLRTYCLKNLPPFPIMMIRERKHDKKNPKRMECCLEAIGTTKSIADATVIKTAYEILRAEGHEDLEIEINSVGDKDSLARFVREISAYYRKHITELDLECRQALKKNPFDILRCTHEKCKPLHEKAPKPMNYLSEASRIHFTEVLELLETINLPFSINSSLIDNHEFASHTIFTIKSGTDVLARGTRWSNLAKRIGIKKDIPGVSVALSLKKPVETKNIKISKPQFYFVQMGQEAKLKSLIVIELLRQARIPIHHSLTKDKLTAQLMSAEHLKVPYVLIMGQKESLENTVLVREMSNSCQETVKITLIANYLRNIIK